jgi:hypothetical protein
MPSCGNLLSSFLAYCLLASLWPLLYGAYLFRVQNRPCYLIVMEPHKKGGVVSFSREADKMSQAHALCKEKRGHTTSIHPADSIAQKQLQHIKLLAVGLYVHARGEERMGSTNTPHLKHGAWMATSPTPVSTPLRSQNRWQLEAPLHLESTCLGPHVCLYAGQETHPHRMQLVTIPHETAHSPLCH